MKNLNTTPNARKYSSLLLFFIAIISMNAFAQMADGQTAYKIADGSKISVSGTSNLHNWTSAASSFTCEANAKIKAGQLQDISSLNFSLPVTNLKSKESLMDTRTYKAMKASEYSRIIFKLTNAMVSNQKSVKVTGDLTIAGVTKEITIQGAYFLSDDEVLTLTGSKDLKMSDYNIKAPSFMLGALKTGNGVTIDVLLKLKKSSLISQLK